MNSYSDGKRTFVNYYLNLGLVFKNLHYFIQVGTKHILKCSGSNKLRVTVSINAICELYGDTKFVWIVIK